MNILYASDDNYAYPMGVSITSLFENNKTASEINVFVLESCISNDNKQKLSALADSYNRNITLIDTTDIDTFLESIGAKQYYGSHACWYRCFLGRLLPSIVDRVLYVDCDTLFLSNIEGIFDVPPGDNKAIGMAEDFLIENYRKKCIGLTDKDTYYNSGVMLTDISRWNELRCEEKLLCAIKSYGNDFVSVDQDALNYAIHEHIMTLPQKYNYFAAPVEISAPSVHSKKRKSTLISSSVDPVIVHFISLYKRPWFEDSIVDYVKEWRENKAISPWASEPLRRSADKPPVVRHPLRKSVVNFVSRFAPRLIAFLKRLREKRPCKTCTRNLPCKKKRSA